MNRLAEHTTRDLVQARLLGALFSNSVRGEVALKGGFAMRVMAASTRYTKDIDLAASPTIPLRTVQSCVRKAIAGLAASGLVQGLEVSEPKQTDTTQRWKIAGKVGGSVMHLTVEVSRRSEAEATDVHMARYVPMPGLGAVPIACIGLPSLSAAKVDCLANPKREAPRDVYDLFLLIKMDVRPSPEAIKAYGRAKLAEIRDTLWGKLEKMDYDVARQELLGFLPPETAAKITPDVWDEMRLEVEDKVCGWINEALGEAGPWMRREYDEAVAARPC